MDTLGIVLESGQKTLSRRDLEQSEPPIDVLDAISNEIIDGERKLEQDERKRTSIRLRMLQGSSYKEQDPSQNLPADSQNEPANKVEEDLNTNASPPPARKKGTKRGIRIKRKPKRDKVGGGRTKRAA
jgi:hypothetical protein